MDTMSLDFSLTSKVETAWSIQGPEKVKYENIFESLKPLNGKLSGEVVRPVLLNSKLQMEILGKIWQLADIDNDGFLDKDEFCVAMHLVYRAIDKEPVPVTLPMNLTPPSKRGANAGIASVPPTPVTNTIAKNLPGAIGVLPPIPVSPHLHTSRQGSTSSSTTGISPKHVPTGAVAAQWVVSSADKARFSAIYQQNKDPDGLISGAAARNVFVQSGLPQTVLAHVWNMCDQQLAGKLRIDQFILAMHLISQKVTGVELPNQITPEMLAQISQDSTFGDNGSVSDGSSGIGDSAAMRELDALNQEIEELRKEKESLTAEIQQKEATIKNVNNEVQELQDTLDKDSSSLAQLECDKAEAHTRLEELEQQRNKLDSMLADVRLKVQEENENIKSLRAQISAQEASVNQQETDLKKIRNELAELKQEETQLEQRLDAGKQQQQNVDRAVKEANEQTAQVQTQIKQLKDQEKNITANIEQYDKAITAIKSESNGDFGFDAFVTANPGLGISESVFSMGGLQEKVEDIQNDISEDPFKDNFKAADPFTESDPFSGADPFAGAETTGTTADDSDPFAGSDPFSASAATPAAPAAATKTSNIAFDTDLFAKHDAAPDPFSGQDPFASTDVGSAFNETSASSFSTDPFGGTADMFSSSANSTMNKTNKLETTSQSPVNAASGNEQTGTGAKPFFDKGGFAEAFSDSKGGESLFKDMGAYPPATSTSSETGSDPWGSAFGGSASTTTATNNSSDPFGFDSFSSPSFAAFGSDTKTEKKAPPSRPAKPDEFSVSTSDKSAKSGSKTHKSAKKHGMSEAEQLAWAQEESKKAESERLKKQRQEEADLELAIALSKQDAK